jgi:hypothetical protein
MKPRARLRFRLLPLIIFVAVRCTTMGPDQGGTIEPNEESSIGGTGSEVVGVVNYPENSGTPKTGAHSARHGLPVINGGVFINPVDYLAAIGNGGETPVTETSPDGSFRIVNVKKGTHIIYIRDNGGNAIAKKVTVHENEPRVDAGTFFAAKTAGVSLGYNGSLPGEVLFYIDVRGTGMQLRCADRNLRFTLDRIPAGTEYSVVIRMVKPRKNDFEITAVNPVPGITTTLQWITGE